MKQQNINFNNMEYLKGKKENINTVNLRLLIGKRVEYLRYSDIDKSGRGYYFPKQGVITDVFRRQIEFDNGGEYVSFNNMKEIVLIS